MATFIVRRILIAVITAWAALTLMFGLIAIMPGDGIDARSSEKAAGSAQTNLRKKYGLDRPLIVQYGKFVKNIAQGDLGYSFKDDRSVNGSLKETVKNSARLLFWGSFTQIGGSLLLGFLAAAKRNSIADRLSTVLGVAMQALPILVTGLLAQVAFGVFPADDSRNWKWMTLYGTWPSEWRLGVIPNGGWKAIILPSVIVGLVQMAYLARLLRSSMLEVLRADYLRTAVAKGLSRRRVLLKHALRPALIPYITAAGLTLVEIFGIAVQTETLFGIYGIGSKVAEAAGQQDAPTVLGLSSVVILAAIVMSTLIDIGYSILDPRIRVGGSSHDH
jgi:oligopeptide transport system permease protein